MRRIGSKGTQELLVLSFALGFPTLAHASIGVTFPEYTFPLLAALGFLILALLLGSLRHSLALAESGEVLDSRWPEGLGVIGLGLAGLEWGLRLRGFPLLMFLASLALLASSLCYLLRASRRPPVSGLPLRGLTVVVDGMGAASNLLFLVSFGVAAWAGEVWGVFPWVIGAGLATGLVLLVPRWSRRDSALSALVFSLVGLWIGSYRLG